MNTGARLLPGTDAIVEDLVVACALAHKVFIARDNLSLLPYLEHAIAERSGRAVVERLLAMAVKLRFLDDQLSILDRDRRLPFIGSYVGDGVERAERVSVREALNKLIHHDRMDVRVEERGAIVLESLKPDPSSERAIAPGRHQGKRVIIDVDGT